MKVKAAWRKEKTEQKEIAAKKRKRHKNKNPFCASCAFSRLFFSGFGVVHPTDQAVRIKNSKLKMKNGRNARTVF